MEEEKFFKGTSPCVKCPYRKDAPLQMWDKVEFEQLLKNDADPMNGKVYSCHKKNGTVCKGWLINQDKRFFPSINLRLLFVRRNITREYLDKLKSSKPMFKTIEEMCYANYPELENKNKT